jgi:hypothetical protein
VAGIALDADQMHVQAGAPGGDAGVVHPAAPAAAELDHHEAAPRQIDRAQRRTPLGDVGVPVGRDGDGLDRSAAPGEHVWKVFRVDQHAEIVGQVSRSGLQVGRRVPPHDGLRVEAGVVMDEGAWRRRGPAGGKPVQQGVPLAGQRVARVAQPPDGGHTQSQSVGQVQRPAIMSYCAR